MWCLLKWWNPSVHCLCLCLTKELHAFICFYITLLFVSSQRVFLPFTPRELRLSAAVNLNGTSRPSRSLESHPHTCSPVIFSLSRLSARICVFCLPIGYFTETHWWVEIDELQYCFKGVLQHSASLLHRQHCSFCSVGYMSYSASLNLEILSS